MVSESMKEVKEQFIDANEKEASISGEGCLYKFLKEDVLYKGFCVLTDKRLYFEGKYLHKVGRGYRSDKGEYAIDIQDVIGTGFSTTRFGIVFFLEVLFVIVLSVLTALFLRFVEVVDHLYFGYESIISTCLILMVLGLIAVPFYYYLKPFKIFVIEYAGGGIAFLTFDFMEEDMKVFQKELYKAKNSIALAKEALVPAEAAVAPGVCQKDGISDGPNLAEDAE